MSVSSATHTAVHPGAPKAQHSGRLRYADPQDLPSFPSVGLTKKDVAASAAASLGWANTQDVQPIYVPGKSASASAAAVLAKDYKSPQAWQPERSSAGSHAAYLARDYKMTPSWQPEPSHAGSRAAILAAGAASKPGRGPPSPNTWGNTAASHAFKAERPRPPTTDMTALNRQRSMRAAKGAMAGSRPRSNTMPVDPSHPGRGSAGAALSAATVAHRPSVSSAAMNIQDTGSVPFVTMDRRMYTSNPPVRIETDDKQRADVLHASAVAMAKRMYTQQQKAIEQTKQATEAAVAARGRSPSLSDHDVVQPMRFGNLQEAAYRLAQERLAKLHEEHQRNRENSEFQDYYGAGAPASPTRRFTLRNRLRRRASSDGDVFEDRKRSQQIRSQMSLFSDKVVEVDEQKRRRDREALLAAAQRNVKAQLQGMDEKVFEETGKVGPSLLSEWELKAHAAAQARSQERTKNGNYGKVDIGAGRFMDQKEVNDIAARRVQPVLDEINQKAEEERERQIAQRMEEKARRDEAERDKEREKEIKEIHKQLKEQNKDEERARKAELKQEEKARREEEKAAKAEQKRIAREEKSKRHDETAGGAAAAGPDEPADDEPRSPEQQPAETEHPSSPDTEEPSKSSSSGHKPGLLNLKKLQIKGRGDRDQQQPPPQGPSTPTQLSPDKSSPAIPEEGPASPGSKVRNWLKLRFTRPRARSSPAGDESGGGKGFIGGVALARQGTGSVTSLGEDRSASMREVALAGRQQQEEEEETGAPERSGLAILPLTEDEPARAGAPAADPGPDADADADAVSLLSISSDDSRGGRYVEAREGLAGGGGLSPPRPIRDPAAGGDGRLSASPDRGSKFLEMME